MFRASENHGMIYFARVVRMPGFCAALARTAERRGHRIDVAVEGGDVVLQGRVPCVAARERVEQVAWDVPTVTRVRNQLRVSR